MHYDGIGARRMCRNHQRQQKRRSEVFGRAARRRSPLRRIFTSSNSDAARRKACIYSESIELRVACFIITFLSGRGATRIVTFEESRHQAKRFIAEKQNLAARCGNVVILKHHHRAEQLCKRRNESHHRASNSIMRTCRRYGRRARLLIGRRRFIGRHRMP